MRKYIHWLKINRHTNDESEQYKNIQAYLNKYPEAKATIYLYDSGSFSVIVKLECSQCYNDLDLDVNSFSTNLEHLNRKPKNITEKGLFYIPEYMNKEEK